MSSRFNFQVPICLTVIGRIAPAICIFINHSRQEVERKEIFESENICEICLTFENSLKLTTIQNVFEIFS